MSTFSAMLVISNQLSRNLTNGRAELAHGVVAPGALPSTILRGKTTLEILVNGLNGM